MKTSVHWVLRSGEFYLTWLKGWSKNIDNAMFVRPDVVVGRNQELLTIRRETRRVII